eukprot:scaffold879_cov410-Prasinococcus_capsulatus_cf.AAC.15
MRPCRVPAPAGMKHCRKLGDDTVGVLNELVVGPRLYPHVRNIRPLYIGFPLGAAWLCQNACETYCLPESAQVGLLVQGNADTEGWSR